MSGVLLFPLLALLCLVPVFVHLASWTPDDPKGEPDSLEGGPLRWDATEDLADVFVREMNR